MTRIEAIIRWANAYRHATPGSSVAVDPDTLAAAAEERQRSHHALLASAILPDEPVSWRTFTNCAEARRGDWRARVSWCGGTTRAPDVIEASVAIAWRSVETGVWTREGYPTVNDARAACEDCLRLLAALDGLSRQAPGTGPESEGPQAPVPALPADRLSDAEIAEGMRLRRAGVADIVDGKDTGGVAGWREWVRTHVERLLDMAAEHASAVRERSAAEAEARRLAARERDFIEALDRAYPLPVADGGRYRNDIIARVERLARDRAAAQAEADRLRAELEARNGNP